MWGGEADCLKITLGRDAKAKRNTPKVRSRSCKKKGEERESDSRSKDREVKRKGA